MRLAYRIEIKNADGEVLGIARNIKPDRWDVHRISKRGPQLVNVGREFNTAQVATILVLIKSETGYVTWEQWKKLLRRVK